LRDRLLNDLTNVLRRSVEITTQSRLWKQQSIIRHWRFGDHELNSEKLNGWLTLLANIGVVIGLALLIYEIRQSQNLAETEAAVRRLDQIQVAQIEMATSELLAEIRVRALSEGVDSLTSVELYKLQLWEGTVRLRMRSQYIEYVRGYLDQDTANGVVEAAVNFLPYWEELGYELGESDFEQAIKKAAGR
jgi:hypothetical protein